MCGLIFFKSRDVVDVERIRMALLEQEWRGPDSAGVTRVGADACVGHVRLSILDLSHAADQPMKSRCGRYTVVFNGEIYNHAELRKRFSLICRTNSDTETIVEGFVVLGPRIFQELDGMFSIVLIDNLSGDWWAARDRFGIKPLFRYTRDGTVIISSETVSIRTLVPCTVSADSIEEWKVIRRPLPGYTYFNEIEEVLPGTVLGNGHHLFRLTIDRQEETSDYDQDELESLIADSIRCHELSDVENVCLLSGGIDSSLITALSSARRAYTVGLPDNNEFESAADTALKLGKELVRVEVTTDALIDAWRTLINLRGEPLSVPNEGLIYLVCKSMQRNEKVVLTGEGADEVFFGYDRVFRVAADKERPMSRDDFFKLYAYSPLGINAPRLVELVEEMWKGKSNIEFVEDFFLTVHLPGLLRRMDGASMAASKEARVPFVANKLVQYMYRRSPSIKISLHESKIPLRDFASRLGLQGPLNRPKIGFSSTFNKQASRMDEYELFRKFNMEALGWS